MLSKLHIEHIALIDNLELDISDGFVVLTGETGAGKSIVIDAVNLVLGERADRSLIQTGQDKAFVQAFFEIRSDNIKSKLEQLDIQIIDGGLLLSRELTTVGKNTCRINGRLCTVSELQAISRFLVDIHGQHEHQTLLKISTHIEFLDEISRGKLQDIKSDYTAQYNKLNAIKRLLRDGKMSVEELSAQEETLKKQIAEIDDANMFIGEDDDLDDLRNILINKERIQSAVSIAAEALEGDSEGEWQGASSLLGLAIEQLKGISDFSTDIEQLSESLQETLFKIEDIATEVRNHGMLEEFDPFRYDEIEGRLQEIYVLKKKYGAKIKDIFKFRDNIQEKLEKTIETKTKLLKGESELSQLNEQVYNISIKLSDVRKTQALVLEKRMMKELSQLGMKKAVFKVSFSDIPDISDARFKANGLDEAEFLLSANTGEDLKPLSKVASGGELSRIMLAFKSISAGADPCETVIFDEIDTGISGSISEVVGLKMKKIAQEHQVICVTHSAQIAAMADEHFFIKKNEISGRTKTDVIALDYDGRVEEIARIISGSHRSENAREHAKQMINSGEDKHKN